MKSEQGRRRSSGFFRSQEQPSLGFPSDAAQCAAMRMIMRVPIAAKVSNLAIVPRITKSPQAASASVQQIFNHVTHLIDMALRRTRGNLGVLVPIGIRIA